MRCLCTCQPILRLQVKSDRQKIRLPGGAVAYTPGFEPRTLAARIKCVSDILCRRCDTINGFGTTSSV